MEKIKDFFTKLLDAVRSVIEGQGTLNTTARAGQKAAQQVPVLDDFFNALDNAIDNRQRMLDGDTAQKNSTGEKTGADVRFSINPEFEKKYDTLSKGYLPFRINHWSWWKQELPSKEEMEEGRQNLEKHDNKVDFIVTHSCASSTQALLGNGFYSKDYLNDYLEEIRQKCTFKKWFFGHYHDNRNVNAEEILLWEQIIRIA